jgi:hypothetical protein
MKRREFITWADAPRACSLLLASPRCNGCAFYEALQLPLATLGGVNNGTPLVLLIVIAPSPAVATSISTSNLANPPISPWESQNVARCGGSRQRGMMAANDGCKWRQSGRSVDPAGTFA